MHRPGHFQRALLHSAGFPSCDYQDWRIQKFIVVGQKSRPVRREKGFLVEWCFDQSFWPCFSPCLGCFPFYALFLYGLPQVTAFGICKQKARPYRPLSRATWEASWAFRTILRVSFSLRAGQGHMGPCQDGRGLVVSGGKHFLSISSPFMFMFMPLLVLLILSSLDRPCR